MMILNIINIISVFVIALVCAMTIIKYHRTLGCLVTTAIFLFMLSCVSLAYDDFQGSNLWALPLFRALAATACVTSYIKLRKFWKNYGVFIVALQRSKSA